MLGGPHGGKFNNSKSRRLIDQVVYDGRKLPGPGQYDGTYEPVDVPLAGESTYALATFHNILKATFASSTVSTSFSSTTAAAATTTTFSLSDAGRETIFARSHH